MGNIEGGGVSLNITNKMLNIDVKQTILDTVFKYLTYRTSRIHSNKSVVFCRFFLLF